MRKSFTAKSFLLCGAALFLYFVAYCAVAPCSAQDKPAITSASPGDQDQSTPQNPGQPTYSLSVQAQIVLLDVAVNDAKGQPVYGLKKDDFTVLEDGTPQKVVSFDAIEPARVTEGKTIPIHSTAELDRLEPNLPVSIIVLDELTVRFEDEYFARYSLEKYLSKQGETLDQPMMLIAQTMDHTNVLHDYTTSKHEILDALKRHLVGNDWRNNNASFTSEQTGAAFVSLIEVARATQGHPGHKNLVWIGRGFPTIPVDGLPTDQVDALKNVIASCVDILRDARITLYALDPTGVAAPQQSTNETGDIVMDDPFGGQIDFDSMVRATGGQSLHGRNDVDATIGTAVNNGETFYSLAYHASSPSTEAPKQFRKIQVVLKDPTLIATAREGYYPAAQEIVGLKDGTGNKEAAGKLTPRATLDLSAATSGLMVFDGVPLTIARDTSNNDLFHLSFPAATAGLAEQDGKLGGDITLIALSYDKNGKLIGKSGRVISLHLAGLKPGESESRKVEISTSVETQSPAARVRFIVRANGNGRIGADNFFLVDRNTLKDPATGIKPITTAH